MTKLHFNRAAEIVRAIAEGNWTSELPKWADYTTDHGADYEDRVNAVRTAEAFILVFQQFNSRFDETRFLQACGLVEATKGRK